MTTIDAIYPFFRAQEWSYIKGRGDVAITELDKDTVNFDHLFNEEVIISSPERPELSGLYRVQGVERFSHSPPWHRGEKIGLLVTRV